MNTQTKTILAIVAIVAAVGLAATVVTSNMAYAKITSETHNKPDKGNPQGNGNGLTTENVNPTGKAPPGQNK
jgi:hypothetical protein